MSLWKRQEVQEVLWEGQVMGERRKNRYVDPSKGHPNDAFYGIPLWMRRLEARQRKRRKRVSGRMEIDDGVDYAEEIIDELQRSEIEVNRCAGISLPF